MALGGTMDRAEFLRRLGAVIGGRWMIGADGAPLNTDGGGLAPGTLPERRLGRTGVMLPILGLGGWHLGDAGSERAAHALVESALAEGIRFLDTAESWLGAAVESLGVRKQVFLMTKTYDLEHRGRDSAARHLEGSLRRLRTD